MIDERLEREIDEAGRDDVFDYMRAMGWSSYNAPPKWVWRAAAYEVRQRKLAALRSVLVNGKPAGTA